jgi:hypothetical protein
MTWANQQTAVSQLYSSLLHGFTRSLRTEPADVDCECIQTWWPNKCDLSRKSRWGKRAASGFARCTGPRTPGGSGEACWREGLRSRQQSMRNLGQALPVLAPQSVMSSFKDDVLGIANGLHPLSSLRCILGFLSGVARKALVRVRLHAEAGNCAHKGRE